MTCMLGFDSAKGSHDCTRHLGGGTDWVVALKVASKDAHVKVVAPELLPLLLLVAYCLLLGYGSAKYLANASLPNKTPPIGKIHPTSNIAVTFKTDMQFLYLLNLECPRVMGHALFYNWLN